MSFINIPANESGLTFSLEQYYSELTKLIGEREGQPLVLNNTITTFDIDEEAPLYSEGLFRRFADRKFKTSPRDLGSSSEADRYSFEYERVIDVVTTKIDATIDPDSVASITSYKREIGRIRREMVQFEKGVARQWDAIVKAENLSPDDPRYELRRLNFLESILYADQKSLFTQEIHDYNRSINIIRMSAYTLAQQKLLRAGEELAEAYKIARPWASRLEKDMPDLNEIMLADPKLRVVQLCDISPSIFPSSDLVRFQNRPSSDSTGRTITVQENTVHNELHTRTWGAGGEASYSSFFIRIGGSGGGSGSSSYRRDFEQLKSFEISFADIEEVYADRGLWFDPTLFEDQEIKDLIDTVPGARELEYVAVSLVIARGIKLSLSFKTEVETERWKKESFRARGGVKIFGYRFGGRGTSSSYDYDLEQSVDKKTVTFKDDPKHCRLLAVRVEQAYNPSLTDDRNKILRINGGLGQKLLDKLSSGDLKSSVYQSLKFKGLNEDTISSELDNIS